MVAGRVRPLGIDPEAPPTLALPARDALAALSLDSPGARRHSIACKHDESLPLARCNLPLPVACRLAALACRHKRAGADCAPSCVTLPDELWARIFSFAVTTSEVPNVIELGDTVRTGGLGKLECGLAFEPSTSQQVLYECLLAPLVDSALEGFSTALITFGARGSGKSYTLEGSRAHREVNMNGFVSPSKISPSAARDGDGSQCVPAAERRLARTGAATAAAAAAAAAAAGAWRPRSVG